MLILEIIFQAATLSALIQDLKRIIDRALWDNIFINRIIYILNNFYFLNSLQC